MNRKLTDQQVIDIRSSSLSCSELAPLYGIGRKAIYKCREGITYKHINVKSGKYLHNAKSLTKDQVVAIRSGKKTALELGILEYQFYYAKKKGTYKSYDKTEAEKKEIIKYYLERGYLNYGQIAKCFKVSTQTIYNLNTCGSRPDGRPRRFNQITYTYFKVLYEQLGSYQKVADKVGESQQNVYRLLTRNRMR